jgi:glucose/arabinose dehydrogenase
MKRFNIFLFIIISFALNPGFILAQDGKTIYQTYCQGCHGANLEGGLSTALIKDDWKYGRTRGLMIRNVKYGIPNTEMIAWGQVIGNDGVKAVVDFIIASQTNPPTAARAFPKTVQTDHYKLKVKTIAEGEIETPWGIEFIDQDRALVTEQPGRLRWLINEKLDPKPITGLPEVHVFSGTLGGMMDIALDPDYAENGWIYLAFSQTDGENGDRDALAMTKIVRGKIKDYQWTEEQELFSAPESIRVTRATRWGSRILFDRDGYLFFSIGDLDVGEDCQDLSKANGKIFRIFPDGTIPKDNPFVNVEGALPGIYALGSRNAQGLAIHPETGEIWATEHGPMGGDELNIIKKGANYGWPVITYGKNYDGNTVSELTEKEGMEQPVIHWTPSIAVCPAEFSTSTAFPMWKNNLFVGALAFEEIRRLAIKDNKVWKQEVILKNYGRIRDVKFGKDGALYLSTRALFSTILGSIGPSLRCCADYAQGDIRSLGASGFFIYSFPPAY